MQLVPSILRQSRQRFRVALLFLGLFWGCGGNQVTPPRGPEAPKDLAATVNGRTVHITWTKPAGTTRVKVLRQLNADPAGPADTLAVLVYAGSDVHADDSLAALLPNTAETPRTYYYVAFGGDASGTYETKGVRATLAATLVQCLQIGGYTLYFNHASADLCTDHFELGTAASTSVPDWWKSCDSDCATATARQLTTGGIQEATMIGQDMRTRKIPLGQVFSSEFCRCIQTAQYLLSAGGPEPDPGITLFVYDEAARCEASMTRLRRMPAPGTNLVFVGHTEFPAPCSVLSTLVPGEAAVYKPDGKGGAAYVARVLADEWATLP